MARSLTRSNSVLLLVTSVSPRVPDSRVAAIDGVRLGWAVALHQWRDDHRDRLRRGVHESESWYASWNGRWMIGPAHSHIYG
jgi:hypothetical protein